MIVIFNFCVLNQPLFLEDSNLNEAVGVEDISENIYYTETKMPLSEPGFSGLEDKQDFGISTNLANSVNPDSDSFLGKSNDTAYSFHYSLSEIASLDYAFLATMKTCNLCRQLFTYQRFYDQAPHYFQENPTGYNTILSDGKEI